MLKNKLLEFLKLDGLLDSAKGYIDARMQLMKLELQEKAANVITASIFIIMVSFCSLMALMFLSIALGELLKYGFRDKLLGLLHSWRLLFVNVSSAGIQY